MLFTSQGEFIFRNSPEIERVLFTRSIHREFSTGASAARAGNGREVSEVGWRLLDLI
jgi:hypothetical protein